VVSSFLVSVVYLVPLSFACRVQFGQPIADFQGMQFQYAEAAIHIEAARTMMYNAARMKQAGAPFHPLLEPFLNAFRASGR
jgi:alkylation response protein AidB-like acyl-CoA dehydrogenase